MPGIQTSQSIPKAMALPNIALKVSNRCREDIGSTRISRQLATNIAQPVTTKLEMTAVNR